MARIDNDGRLVGTSSELAGGSSTTFLQVTQRRALVGVWRFLGLGQQLTLEHSRSLDNESGNDKYAAIGCVADLDHDSRR